VVFALNLMIPPNVFDGRDGFVRRHGIRAFCNSLAPSWELIAGMLPSQIDVLETIQAWVK
jgi:hypothetical protein